MKGKNKMKINLYFLYIYYLLKLKYILYMSAYPKYKILSKFHFHNTCMS